MPINEILAPYYLVGKLATPAYPLGHQFRLYFQTGYTLVVGPSGDEENYHVHVGATDKGSISALVHSLFTRAGALIPASSHVLEIALWQSVFGAPNILIHLNSLPVSNTYGSGEGIASAYSMYVFGTALRPQFRCTFFDGVYVNPQKATFATPPDTDDDSVGWLFIKSGYGLSNNDGEKLTRPVSFDTGYNRKLARSYGKTISP